ncbi:MAG TPA: hypothetical protein DEB17_01925 [Chlorobaculum sp.]|uniref:Uncharacterized protein n=1 Tax=Chlorobaculum tepidum (strain ATCC 49652 / DSM 12025 / NBRC 103806 / TLS) TaxID=194439 RepID=Q8KDJ4_CHLTE|nr:hypothetical protein CT1056 [Chlorobaculum tepidum TLS]HBU22757.1 hypothetical protein [Chlorobaculum sp.]
MYDQLTNLIVLKTYYKNKRIDRTAYSVTALFKVTCPVYPVRSSVYRPVRYRQIVNLLLNTPFCYYQLSIVFRIFPHRTILWALCPATS